MGPSREETSLMKRISELLSREESLARQRSRALYLKEGDHNTGFFHARARERRYTNRIKSLTREDGVVLHRQAELEEHAAEFYGNLFSAQEESNPELVTDYVPAKVTEGMNDQLLRPFTDNEIESALFMMHPDKSPGPDGLTAGFYIRHWHLLREAVCKAVRNFFGGRRYAGCGQQHDPCAYPKGEATSKSNSISAYILM